MLYLELKLQFYSSYGDWHESHQLQLRGHGCLLENGELLLLGWADLPPKVFTRECKMKCGIITLGSLTRRQISQPSCTVRSSGVVSERISSRIQFPPWSGLSLRDKELLHPEEVCVSVAAPLQWTIYVSYCILFRASYQDASSYFALEVILACPTGGKPYSRATICGRYYLQDWGFLWIPAEQGDTWTCLLNVLLLQCCSE